MAIKIKEFFIMNHFNMKLPSQLMSLIIFLLIAVLACFYIRYNSLYGLDDSYITYRYAQNLEFGIGLVFNEGERYFGSTAMGMAILLAGLSWIVDGLSTLWLGQLPWPRGDQIPLIAHWVSAISIGAIVILAYRIVLHHIAPHWAFLVSSAFALYLFPAEYMSAAAGHETYLFLAFLGWSGYLLIYKEYSFWAGTLLGITTTFRPDSLLYTVILAAWLFLLWIHSGFTESYRHRLILFLVGYGLISFLWFGFCGIYFGQIFPETLIAKRAQPLLGDFKSFTIKATSRELMQRLRWPIVMVVALLIFSSLLIHILSRKGLRAWWDLLGNRLTAFIGCLLVFGFGQVIFYSLLNVSFWFWYVFPLCIILVLCGLLALVDLLEGFRDKVMPTLFKIKVLVLVAVVSLIFINLNALRYDLHQLLVERNMNLQLTSYDPIIDYLKVHEPNGTSIATAEPGALGFKLGSRYRTVDELGLTSPGVAKNIMTGNLDYPFTAYAPAYIIVSWPGKYSPHERPWFSNAYGLVGEFTHPYWDFHLKRGAYLYKRKS